MGLFSSKKKYTVNVTVQPIFEEKQIPISAKNGIIRGLMGETDIVDNMLEELSSSIGIRASTGMGWLKRQDYAIGTPSSAVKTYLSAQSVVYSAIQANIGKTITPTYYSMGPLNSMHFGWAHCFDSLAYDPASNELKGLTAQTGYPCYLVDMKATYLKEDFDFMVETNDLGMLDQLGPSPASGWLPSNPFNALSGIGQYAAQPAYEVSDVASEDYLTITYEFQTGIGTYVRRGVTVSMANIDNTADFHMCRYVDSAGKTGFFTYQHGTGTYPAIDAALLMEHEDLGTYYPWAYFRRSGRDATHAESETTLKQMRKWCNHLGVDYDKLHEGVHEDPNVDDVEQAILMFGVKPSGQHQGELEYLFKNFSLLHENSVAHPQLVPSGALYGQMQAFTSSPSQVQKIQDKRFAMSFQYSGIRKQRVSGKIGNPGTYTGHYATISQNSQVFLTQTSTGTGVGTTDHAQPAWIYRYQVLDAVYEEVAIFNLRVNYEVHAKKGFAAGGQDPELLIPVDHAIVRTMGVPAREQLLCRALHMMVNTVIVTKTKWYASPVFKVVLIIIAIVITILSLGQAWATIAAAAAISATAVVITVIVLIVEALVVRYATKLFVKAVGPELAIVAAIVAMAYGSYSAVTAEPGTTSWGENLVALGNNLVTESNSAYQSMVEDVMSDIQDYQAWAQGQFDTLAEKRESLGLNPNLAGLGGLDVVKLAPGIVIGEKPTDYYNRTVHSGNIGVTSYDMITYFAESNLMLPRINQVDGDFQDGRGFGIPTA